MKRIQKTRTLRGVYERKMSEEDVIGQIRTFLEAHGAVVHRVVERVPKCYRCGQWLGASEGGIPDLMGWFRPDSLSNNHMHPVHFFIECKAPTGGRKRPKQEDFVKRANRDDVLAFFANSLADVHAMLSSAGLRLAKL